MGKSTKTSNYAVSGITGTSTTKPTTSVSSYSTGNGSGSSYSGGSGSGSSGTTGSYGSTGSSYNSKSSGNSASTYGSSGGSSAGSAGSSSSASQAYTPSYANQFYNAYLGSNLSSGNSGVDLNAAAKATKAIVNQAKASIPEASVSKLNHVDTTEAENKLKEIAAQQTEQAKNQIDYAVSTGVNQLRRAYEDALPGYQTQRNQIAADEANALDNQVLYAAQRGDSGGIGQSQYGAIQNTAATSKQAVNSAQMQLYTDTSRQVADLQAQGEFEKADKVLEISINYQDKLYDLQKWALDENVGIDEFNAELDKWKAEYDLSVSKYLTDTELSAAKLTGATSDGTGTADTLNSNADRLVNSAKAMISAGIVPSEEQLAAMGWTPQQYWIYKMTSG